MDTPSNLGRRVLIAEDSRIQAKILEQFLVQAGYQVRVAWKYQPCHELAGDIPGRTESPIPNDVAMAHVSAEENNLKPLR